MEAQNISHNNEAHIAVVVPCYNEADRLDADAFMRFTGENPEFSFLFVDDGSTDATPLILKEVNEQCASVSILTLQKNAGKAEAVRQGMIWALNKDCDYVAFIDADLATPLNALFLMHDACKNDADVLLASAARVRLLGRNIIRSVFRHYLGRIFATTSSIIFDLHAYDTQCGAKLFKNEPEIHSLFAQPFYSRWIFDIEIFLRLKYELQKHGKMLEVAAVEVPLQTWIDHGHSRITLKDFLCIPIDICRIYIAYHRRPIASSEG